ncbi:putative helicase associated domain (HA2) Add an annotation [Lyophyllum shimeji]|uniref:RNA helicase n=1 Tax=Lyophyllum shimeji TaxID=47721 RepID=A0A9P3UJV5_LYOSH|nr:putative helicase associated domain (HA2) Add an annotation [Lyophyllum shimeji]
MEIEWCQKQGWEKPSVETHKHPGGWSFVVYLSKINKKTNQKESIRLEPDQSYPSPTALEARHWGATYALYRFCNGMQLHLVLPPGPREYWNELAVEHKNSPPHLKWKYAADPFAAREEAKANAAKRQVAAAQNASSSRPSSGQASGEFSQSPEVRMATSLREQVEEAIKKGISMYPEANDAAPSVLDNGIAAKVTQQLGHLGFTAAQTRNALSFLSQPSRLATSLLETSSPLEACIEYLVLHVPECDLPQRFLPALNSSNPFITSAHSGTEDLKRRWVEDKAVKEAGWPAHAVKQFTAVPSLLQNWDKLLVALGKRLIGEDWTGQSDTKIEGVSPFDIDIDEVEAMGASMADTTHLVIPLFSVPIQIHILTSSEKAYPRPGFAPMYVTSASVPAYVRLHLLSCLLVAMNSEDFLEPGEGFCMAVMRVLEGEWAKIEDNGPPEMSMVLVHFIPKPPVVESLPPDAAEISTAPTKGDGRRRGPMRRDERTDQQIRQEFEALCKQDGYAEMLAMRQKLPAFEAKEEFLQQLEKNRVVVVVGETGCGKTTQLPQFILDSLIQADKGSKASILVTQPRRISAISVAARVSTERLDDGSVGYAIRGESRQSQKTKLLFCTTGVVLRRLGSGDKLEGVSHIVVDEVHERSVDGDFLLLELKELLKKHSALKVVLMSATINHETFVKYFDGAPLMTIPGFTHPVTDKYLEDLIPLIKYHPPTPKSGPKQSEEALRAFRDEYRSMGLDDASITTIHAITRSDRIDFQLIAALVDHIVSTAEKRGGILIFLPGVQEIRQCIDAMHPLFAGKQVDIFPLHANLSSEEQRRVFPKTSGWKVIAATNVAETSITIDDVIYVVDAGKVKETQYDPETSLSRLVETWVTRAAARQRRGRAGRTQPGVCYKLYTRKQELNMAKFPVPEILRVPLESISLTVKVMREEEDVKLFLSRAIDPPKVAAMERAWSTLEELGAVDEAGRLTPLGRHMSTLPVDLRLAKMLILATVFQCLDPVLTIAAALSSKPLFLSPMDKRGEAAQARARFSTAGSDLLTDLHAYNECSRLRSEGKGHAAIRVFCEQNFISPTTIREITALRHDFLLSLADLGFIPLSSAPSSPALNKNSGNLNLIKAVILGGLWPRVARVHLPKDRIKFDKVQAGTIQRENTAKEYKIYDLREGRVFLHPGSVLFGEAAWKTPFLVYFHKYMSTKVFLRDATEVPLYALLLFGGRVSVNQIGGGLTIGGKESFIKLRAWPRIGILVNQLRRLLDAQLQRCVEEGTMLTPSDVNPVLQAMLALLTHDGLTE